MSVKQLFLLSFLLLAGCTMGPDYKRPEIELPETWQNILVNADVEKENVEWWTHFEDEILINLVNLVLNQNFDLKAAEASILQNQQILEEARSNLLPLVDLSVHTSKNELSKNYFNGGIRKYNFYGALPSIRWEIDVFGKLRRAKEGALADLQAQVENSYGLFLSLVSNVAESYISLRSAQQRLETVLKLVQVYKKIYELTLELESSGLSTGIDSENAKSAWESYEALVYPLETAIKRYIYSLGALTSQAPEALGTLLGSPRKIPTVSPTLFVGLPSDLLERRPDIRKAEMVLASATAHIGFRKANFFPSFSLTGTLGVESYKASNLLSSNSLTYALGGGLNWHIFDFGRIKSQVLAAEALETQAYFNYRQTILNALAEVESSLVAYQNEHKRQERLKTAWHATKKAATLTKDRYKAGLLSQIAYFQIRVEVLNKTLDYLSSQEFLALNTVNLYKALGGGWEPYAQKILEQDSNQA
ncbi:MAG: efflux transporter outer membrane subunit [Alphaproteobacteria bacterium]